MLIVIRLSCDMFEEDISSEMFVHVKESVFGGLSEKDELQVPVAGRCRG